MKTTDGNSLLQLAQDAIETSEIPMQALSALSGVAQPTLSRWRRGVNEPTPEHAARLARATRRRALEMLEAARALEVEAARLGGA